MEGPCLPHVYIFNNINFLPFHTVHGALQARILELVAIYFSHGTHFVKNLTITRPSWMALNGLDHSFIE